MVLKKRGFHCRDQEDGSERKRLQARRECVAACGRSFQKNPCTAFQQGTV